MIGFFEYQYLKFKKKHLRNLVALARIDGNVHEEELKFLHRIGQKYGLKENQIVRIIEDKNEWEPYIPESHQEKVGVLYDLVGMMLADGIIEDSEIEFITNMVRHFHYDENIIKPMIDLCQKEVKDTFEWDDFLQKTEAYNLKA